MEPVNIAEAYANARVCICCLLPIVICLFTFGVWAIRLPEHDEEV